MSGIFLLIPDVMSYAMFQGRAVQREPTIRAPRMWNITDVSTPVYERVSEELGHFHVGRRHRDRTNCNGAEMTSYVSSYLVCEYTELCFRNMITMMTNKSQDTAYDIQATIRIAFAWRRSERKGGFFFLTPGHAESARKMEFAKCTRVLSQPETGRQTLKKNAL
jgi:hypothetical protein